MAFYFDLDGNLRASELEQWPWLVHCFTTRSAGDLRRPADQRAFARRLGLGLVTLRQIHSAIVRGAGGDGGVAGLAGDALVGARPGRLLGIKTADCLPVLLVDERRRAVAAIHGGWRGLARRVVEKSAGEMRRRFSTRPADLHAAIGPGIQACCFEVGPEVLEEFCSQFVDALEFCRAEAPNPAEVVLPRQGPGGGHPVMRDLHGPPGRVDLAGAARRQLLAAGLHPDRIYNAGLCTACDAARFFSWRRQGEAAGRMLSVIGVRRGE